MRKTLEAMYYDNLSVSGRAMNKQGEYYKTEREICEVMSKLEDTFTPQQKELWQEYTSLVLKGNDLGCKDTFILGFRLATSIIFEALADTPDDDTCPIEG